MRHLLIAAVSLAVLSPLNANAQTASRVMCSQPVKPTCVSSDLTYGDQQRIDRCQRDFQNYEDKVKSYLDCLDQKATAQREQLESLRQEFECRQAGGEDC